MTFETEIRIDQNILDRLNKLLALDSVNPNDHGYAKLGNVDVWTSQFPDGKEVDIKMNTSEDDFWAEGILFDNDGSELCCSDVSYSLEGEWEFEYNGNKYVVNVVGE